MLVDGVRPSQVIRKADLNPGNAEQRGAVNVELALLADQLGLEPLHEGAEGKVGVLHYLGLAVRRLLSVDHPCISTKRASRVWKSKGFTLLAAVLRLPRGLLPRKLRIVEKDFDDDGVII